MNSSMVASTSIFTFPSNLILHSNPQLAHFSTPTSIPDPTILRRLSVCCAAKQQSGPVKKPPSTRKKKKKVGGGGGGGGGGRESSRELSLDDFDIVDEGDRFGSDGGGGGGGGRESSRELSLDDFDIVDEGDGFGSDGGGVDGNGRYQSLPLPNPPAGFILDEQGKVVLVSNKRIATLVDPTNNFPLECVIRRVFRSSQGDECMLLCPADMPVQILKSKNIEGWSAVSDEEVETILPTAAYALAKMHMHLVYSGYCYTARGGFCYTEDDIVEFRTDDGQDVDGLPTEGIEITCFHLDGSHYMIYTPSDPLLFVAVKDQNGQLRIVDDELLEDPAVISAIDEETEFNALVEEETALLESLLGKR